MKPRMTFFAAAALVALAFAPGAASAQFVSGISVPGFRAGLFPGGYPIPNPLAGINRAFNPVQFPRGLAFNTPFLSASGSFGPFAFGQGSRNLSIPTSFGTINASRFTNGSYSAYNRFYGRMPYGYYAAFQKYVPPSYSSGGVAMPAFKPAPNPGMVGNAQAMAERNAVAMEGRKQVFDQAKFEKVGVQGMQEPAMITGAPELRHALESEANAPDGETLNTILAASLALEKKGAKAPGVTLAPELLAQIRFAGSPTSEALNLLRSADRLPFPSLFDLDKMRALKEEIEKDFALVAETASTGKAVDQNRVARLTDVVQRARDRVTPVARDLPFEDALAAKRFLNDLDLVAKVLRDGANAGIVNPRWETEGTTIPDLTRHMAKYKLQFGPAARDGLDAYLALHRGLSVYHAALSQPK